MNFCWANRLRGLALLILLWGGQPACAQEAAKAKPVAEAAPIVREVRIVKQDGTVLKKNPPGISVPVGEPLNREQVAQSIHTLYKTGDFANITAQMAPQADGVGLDFVVQENLFINRVVILGLKPPPSEASASGAMGLSLGQTYREGDMREALSRLSDTLRDEGLYEAKVTADKQANPQTHQLDVIVHVDPGPRVRLSNIQLLNNTQYSDADLLKLFRLKSGSELTVARVQSALERIRKFMQKKDHLSASVSIRRGTYDEASNSLPMTLEVTAGPTVQLTVEGNWTLRSSMICRRMWIAAAKTASFTPSYLMGPSFGLPFALKSEPWWKAIHSYFAMCYRSAKESSDATQARLRR